MRPVLDPAPPTLNDRANSKAPYNPKERVWEEADKLRTAHPAGRELPVKVLDLAEFDLHLDLVPVNGLREHRGKRSRGEQDCQMKRAQLVGAWFGSVPTFTLARPSQFQTMRT